MNYQTRKLECCSCGASSLAPEKKTLWKCDYCGSISIFDGLAEISTNELLLSQSAKTRKIEPVLKKAANFMYPNARFPLWIKSIEDVREVADGGHLIVTNTEIVFVPHAFNLNCGYQLVFPLDELSDIRKENKFFGLVRKLILVMKDSSESTFVCWGRDEIINRVSNTHNANK